MPSTIEVQENAERQFLLKQEALLRSSLGNRFCTEKPSTQSKASMQTSQQQSCTSATCQEVDAKRRRRPATRGAVAFSDFLKATGGQTASGCRSPARSNSPVTKVPPPTERSASAPCSQVSSPATDEHRLRTAALRAAAFAHLLPARPTGPPTTYSVTDMITAAAVQKVGASCGVPDPSTTGTQSRLEEALAMVERLQQQLQQQQQQQQEAQADSSPSDAALDSCPDYPAWLLEEDGEELVRDEEEYVVLDKLPWIAPVLDGRHCADCGDCVEPVQWFGKQALHHCVFCGLAFCAGCSSYWTIAPCLGYSGPQRACKECHMRATGNLTPHPALLESRASPSAPTPSWVRRVARRWRGAMTPQATGA